MKLTSDYIYDVEHAVSELFQTIPAVNATWAIRNHSDGYSTHTLELLLIYGSHVRYDHLKDGLPEERSLEAFIDEWKQYVEEATHNTDSIQWRRVNHR